MFSVYLKYIKDCLRFIKQHLMIGECDVSFVYGKFQKQQTGLQSA